MSITYLLNQGGEPQDWINLNINDLRVNSIEADSIETDDLKVSGFDIIYDENTYPLTVSGYNSSDVEIIPATPQNMNIKIVQINQEIIINVEPYYFLNDDADIFNQFRFTLPSQYWPNTIVSNLMITDINNSGPFTGNNPTVSYYLINPSGVVTFYVDITKANLGNDLIFAIGRFTIIYSLT